MAPPPNPPPPPPHAKSGGNVLTRKLGPAPVWLWVVAGIVVFVVYRHFVGAGSSTAATSATGSPDGATPATGGGGSGTPAGSDGSLADSFNAELYAALGALGANDASLASSIQGESSLIETAIAKLTPAAQASPVPATSPATIAPISPPTVPAPNVTYTAPDPALVAAANDYVQAVVDTPVNAKATGGKPTDIHSALGPSATTVTYSPAAGAIPSGVQDGDKGKQQGQHSQSTHDAVSANHPGTHT